MVVAFGEILLRLSPPSHQRLVQATALEVNYGGAEANVLVSLAQLGIPTAMVSRVPSHEVGQAAIYHLQRYGTSAQFVARGGDRLGIYFLETGASQRPSKVIYDRADSSFASASADDYDWDQIFAGATWFHWTGITAAVLFKANKLDILEVALQKAKAKGLTVSCDLNFRAKLWTMAEARSVLNPMMAFTDVLIANEGQAEGVLLESDAPYQEAKHNDAGYLHLAQALQSRYGFERMAFTIRETMSAGRNAFSAALSDGNVLHRSKRYEMELIDRVGGGDAFAAGLIFSQIKQKSLTDCIEFATAASVLKHSIHGDANLASESEIAQLAFGGALTVSR
jgi:2-dehydro-3-deoxygluconokinase